MRTQSQSEGSALPPGYFQSRRQLSQTHSEPDGSSALAGALAGTCSASHGSTSRVSGSAAAIDNAADKNVAWMEPSARLKMMLPTSRSVLRTMHSEYTRYYRVAATCPGQLYSILIGPSTDGSL